MVMQPSPSHVKDESTTNVSDYPEFTVHIHHKCFRPGSGHAHSITNGHAGSRNVHHTAMPEKLFRSTMQAKEMSTYTMVKKCLVSPHLKKMPTSV